jgi:Ca2+-binding RTX toxin-like protein
MHVRRLAFAAALSLASLGIVVPAHAVVPTCDGLEATIVGTDGPDNLVGTEGPDVAFLGSGDDHFAGKGGDDVICGGSGHDVIYPGDGNDTVFGEVGPDTIFEGTGNDHLNGGPGGDTIDYRSSKATGLRVDARIGKATSSSGTDLFYNFETYVGTIYKDHLIGSSAGERIIGLTGRDYIQSLGGNDSIVSDAFAGTVEAGDGDDQVYMRAPARVLLGAGNDQLRLNQDAASGGVYAGGDGFDGVIVSVGNAGYEINLNRGFVQYLANDAVDRGYLNRFENVIGSFGPDRIVGNELPNFLSAGNSNDTVIGLGGDDHLIGGDDVDVADGGSGHDHCLYFEVTTSCAVTD